MTALLSAVRRPTRRAAVAQITVFVLLAVAGFALAGLVVVRALPRVDVMADTSAMFGLAAAPIAVGAGAADLEIGDGTAWVSNGDDGTLTSVDLASGAARTIRVEGRPGQLVVADGAVWVRNLGDRITRVDIATGAVSPPIPTGGGQVGGMTVAGGFVWLSHRFERSVTRVDTRTLGLVGPPVAVGDIPLTLETDGASVFVVESGDGAMSRIDVATARITATVPLGERIAGVEVDRGTVYVAVDNDVVPVDIATFLAGRPYGFADWSYFVVRAGVIWVVFDDDPGFQRYDAATRALIGDRVVGPGNEVGRARVDGDRLWFTLPGRDLLTALAPAA